MGHPIQHTKYCSLIDPAAITNNGAYTSRVIDCLGWDYATAYFQIGVTDIAMAGLKLQESDNNSSWADITASDFGTNTNLDIAGTALALPDANADNSNRIIHLDLTKRKRYVKAVATAGNGTNGTYMAAQVILSRGEVAPNTAAKMGAAVVVVV